MARPRKQTVDYFPHDCDHKKTIFILEQKYGNDGYAFWFKLLEMLGKSEGHYLILSDPAQWEFLTSVTRVADDTCRQILTLLSKLDAIDPELWESEVVWSQNFVDRIKDAYRNRMLEMPVKPDFLRKKPPSNGDILPQSDVRNPQRKVKEKKVKETVAYTDDFIKFYTAYPKKKKRDEAWKAWQNRNGSRPELVTILKSIAEQKQSADWKKENGKYIPYPASWINGGQWADENEVKIERTSLKPRASDLPDPDKEWEIITKRREQEKTAAGGVA